MTSAFIWNDVIANIASIVDVELTNAGINLHSIQPLLAQNCITPLMFPSRNPSVNVTSVKRYSFGDASNGGNRHKGITTYTLDWIYLHVEYTQGLNPYEYEVPIRQNLAAIFRAVVRRDRTLGVGRVLPVSAEIDYNIQDPTSGKMFLGAHLVLGVDEIFEL
jgi:hypothetical protein